MKTTKKFFAFTLAEVLITLAIIGIVAAMTIPILMQNYQKDQQITALKKVYSQTAKAIERVMMDYSVDNFSEVDLLHGATADPKAFFKKYFKVSKYCALGEELSCFPRVASLDKEGTVSNVAHGYTCAILKDGASICVYTPSEGVAATTFIVDTNGINKPNTAGRDIFTFKAYSDGSLDEVTPENRDVSNPAREDVKKSCESSDYGSGCFSKIFDAGWKMDY